MFGRTSARRTHSNTAVHSHSTRPRRSLNPFGRRGAGNGRSHKANRIAGLKAARTNPNTTSAGRKHAKHELRAMGAKPNKVPISTLVATTHKPIDTITLSSDDESSAAATTTRAPPNKKRLHSKLTDSAAAPPVKVAKVHPLFSATSLRPSSLFVWHPSPTSLSCLHGTFSPTSSTAPAPSSKVAAFDLDGTLIKTKSGGPFAKNKNDWCLWNGKVKERVKEMHQQGFAIVVISNQNYKGVRLTWFQEKLPAIAEELGVPLRVFAATEKDKFRKPATGMWDRFVNDFNGGVDVDMEASFFVGDAAGRRGDHSDADIQMAQSAGLPFFTPEQFFV